MNTEQDELQTKLVGTMLAVMELHEKFSKFGTKEITNAVETTVTSKTKKPAIITQLYKLETLIEELRTAFAKASMRALLVPTKEVSEDPVVATVETKVAPTEAPNKKKDEVKSVGEAKLDEKMVVEKAPKKAKKTKEEPEDAIEVNVAEKAPKKSAKAAEETATVPEMTTASSGEKTSKKPKKVTEKVKEEPVVKQEVVVPPKKEDPPTVTVLVPPVNKVTTEEKTPDGSDDESVPIHVRRKNIPKHIKTMVWNIHMGVNNLEAKCFCCRAEKVDARNFQCGHVIAESKGGDLNLKNLRPICRPCNESMGTQSMNEFAKEYFGWEV
jgi:hypothetical protein